MPLSSIAPQWSVGHYLCPLGAVFTANALANVKSHPHWMAVLRPKHFDTFCDTCADVMKLSDAQRQRWIESPMPLREAARRLVVRRAS